MRLIGSLLFIIILVAVFSVGQALYESDIKNNTTRNIYNLTENILQWNSSTFEVAKTNITTLINNSNIKPILFSNRLTNIIYKGLDFFGYSMFEVGKWGIEFGYEHPEYNFLEASKALPKLITIIIGIVIGFLLIKLTLPLFAICYIIGGGKRNKNVSKNKV